MSKRLGLISAIGGIVSSIIGLIGICMLSPLCGSICLAGPLAAIFGIGIVGFLHKYNVWFIIIGGFFFFFGIFLIISNRKKRNKK